MPYNQQNMMQQPMSMTWNQPLSYQPVMQQPDSDGGFKWVSSRKEVDNFVMGPNQVMVFYHRDKPIFWFKISDSSGEALIKTCDYTERDESDDSEEYATKQDIDEIKKMMAKIQEAWND